MLRLRLLYSLLFLVSMLSSSLHSYFHFFEVWADDKDNRYYLLCDYHPKTYPVCNQQRYDFISWAKKLDAACTVEDGFMHYAPHGKLIDLLLHLNSNSPLLGLATLCELASIPVYNAEFRTIRNFFSYDPAIAKFCFGKLTGKKLVDTTYQVFDSIKAYEGEPAVYKLYQKEIKLYEDFMLESQAFFEHFRSSEEDFRDLVTTLTDDELLNCANSLNKLTFGEQAEKLSSLYFDDDRKIVDAHDTPLIDLRLLHSCLSQSKKNRFIAAGSLHTYKLAYFFSELGFKKLYTTGEPYTLGSAQPPAPLDINKVFIDACADIVSDTVPSNALLKFLKAKSAVEQSSFNFLTKPQVVARLWDLLFIAGSYAFTRKFITPALGGTTSRRLKEIFCVGALYCILDVAFAINGRRIAHREHLRAV